MFVKYFIGVMLFLTGTKALVLPPGFIVPCATGGDDLSSECLKSSIQAALPGFARGMPELGIGSLDPLVVESLNLTLPGIKMEIKNSSSKGFKKCVADFASMTENTLEMRLHCNLLIKGKYKSSGRLLMFPIDGDGDMVFKIRNLRLNFILNFDIKIGEDGEKHFNIENYTTSHGYEGRITYGMTNIVKGNSAISQIILDFMNENWHMVAEEFGTPIIDYGVKSIITNIKQFFKTVPSTQLIKSTTHQ